MLLEKKDEICNTVDVAYPFDARIQKKRTGKKLY